jgi:hypothetical protein
LLLFLAAACRQLVGIGDDPPTALPRATTNADGGATLAVVTATPVGLSTPSSVVGATVRAGRITLVSASPTPTP